MTQQRVSVIAPGQGRFASAQEIAIGHRTGPRLHTGQRVTGPGLGMGQQQQGRAVAHRRQPARPLFGTACGLQQLGRSQGRRIGRRDELGAHGLDQRQGLARRLSQAAGLVGQHHAQPAHFPQLAP